MKLSRFIQIGIASILLSGVASAADYQEKGNSKGAISKGAIAMPPLLSAGMFRLESERSYKLSLQMVLGILSGHTKVERTRSFDSIDRLRKEVGKTSAGKEKTQRAFQRVHIALNDQVLGLAGLNSTTASYMYDVNEDLLNKLNFLTFAIESESNEDASHMVGLAMRQASLAQRMAKIILLQSLDATMAQRQGLKVDLLQSRQEFVNGLSLLNDEVKSDQALIHRLDLAQQQWKFYDAAFQSKKLSAQDLRNISSTSDRIAQMMVEMVRLSYGLPPDPSVIAQTY